jgi:hypothetical protein
MPEYEIDKKQLKAEITAAVTKLGSRIAKEILDHGQSIAKELSEPDKIETELMGLATGSIEASLKGGFVPVIGAVGVTVLTDGKFMAHAGTESDVSASLISDHAAFGDDVLDQFIETFRLDNVIREVKVKPPPAEGQPQAINPAAPIIISLGIIGAVMLLGKIMTGESSHETYI